MAGGVEVGIRMMEQAVMVCNGLLKKVHGLQAENERLKVEIADMKRSVQLMSMANQVMRNDLKLAQEKRETAWDEVEHLRSRLQRYEAVVEALKDGINTLLTTNPNQDLINDALEVLARLEVTQHDQPADM